MPLGVHQLVTGVVPSKVQLFAPLDTILRPCSLYLKEPRLVPLVAILHLNLRGQTLIY